MANDISDLSSYVKTLEAKQKGYAFTTTEKIDGVIESVAKLNAKVSVLEGYELNAKVAELNERVAALEGFVKALQAEGYLTLANIKKAAADACPICTHTHEEEQPTE
jgi:outer membrane murein-binding lipoprotein Lpp